MDKIIELLEQYGSQLPLELFVFVGCFVEEIISPVPSFIVLVPAGAAALLQNVGWWYLLVLATIGAVGRLLAAMILYVVADKGEDWLFSNGRRVFGVTHQQLERLGRRFSGSSRDYVLLFLLNALPMLPTSMLSLACGFIKIKFGMFVVATFIGSAVNAAIYLGVGYAGSEAVARLNDLNTTLQVAGGVVAAALVIWYVVRRKRGGKTRKR